MAKISFRQGIVSHPKNTGGQQTFLDKVNGNNSVKLEIGASTSADPVIITFAHGDTDYLYTESKSVPMAWTGCTTGQDYWLYWELDLNTGEMIRGKTTRKPLTQRTQPAAPLRVPGQMWFDTSEYVYKEWQGSVWLEVVRVIAAKLANGTTFHSFSSGVGNQEYAGSQIGSSTTGRTRRRAGSLV